MEAITHVFNMAKQYAKEIKEDGHDNSSKWLLEAIERSKEELSARDAEIAALRGALEKSDAALSAAVVYMKANMRKPYFSVEVDLLHSLKDARECNAALLTPATPQTRTVPDGGEREGR